MQSSIWFAIVAELVCVVAIAALAARAWRRREFRLPASANCAELEASSVATLP